MPFVRFKSDGVENYRVKRGSPCEFYVALAEQRYVCVLFAQRKQRYLLLDPADMREAAVAAKTAFIEV